MISKNSNRVCQTLSQTARCPVVSQQHLAALTRNSWAVDYDCPEDIKSEMERSGIHDHH